MENRLLNLFRKTGGKNILLLSSGTFVAQTIGILCQPLITRLYGPKLFGMLSLMLSLAGIFTPAMCLQYNLCIVSSKSDQEANVITALSILIVSTGSILIGLGLAVYNVINPGTYKDLGPWVHMVSLLVFSSGISAIASSYNNRYEQYRIMNKVGIYRSVASNAVKLLGGFLHLGFIAFVIGTIVSSVAGLRQQTKTLVKNKREILSVSFSEMKHAAIKYIQQPLFSTPGVFVTNYAYTVLPLFFNGLYGIEEVGKFALSMNMLGLPLTLISANVGTVFFKNASKEYAEKGGYYETLKGTTTLLLLIAIPCFLALWFVAEPLFSAVFGPEWARSGTFVKLLIPLYFTRFIATVVVQALIISGKQLLKLIVQCFFIVEIFFIQFFAIKYAWNIETSLTAINYSYTVNYLVIYALVYISSRYEKSERDEGAQGPDIQE